MFGFDFTQAQTYAVPIGALLLVDAGLGAAAAALAGSFKASWLYVFARTKGVAYLAGVALLLLAAVLPDFGSLQGPDGQPVVPPDFFGVLGMGFLLPLAVSLVASIAGNVGELRAGGDGTAPNGVTPNLPDIIVEPVDEE